MVKTKDKPATTTPKKDYSDPTGILPVWKRITELKEVLNDLHEKIMQWTPDDDFYYDLSKEKTKFSQEYVDNIFELWRYARETGAKHSRAEKVEFGIYTGEISELIPEFDQLGNFIKWNYSVMYKNEAGETEFAELLSAIPQGNTAILDSVIVDDQPAEPEAIAPEPEPEQPIEKPESITESEQLNIFNVSKSYDLGNDYLGWKASQLIEILNRLPNQPIVVEGANRVQNENSRYVAIQTTAGMICCAMKEGSIALGVIDGEQSFIDYPCPMDTSLVEFIGDYLDREDFFTQKPTDPVKLQEDIYIGVFNLEDSGDGSWFLRYLDLRANPSAMVDIGHCFPREGFAFPSNRTALISDLTNFLRETVENFKGPEKFYLGIGLQTSSDFSKRSPAKKSKAITKSKLAGKKSKPITESKPPAKNSKPANKKTDGAIAKKSKPITELKPASVNSVITTNGKPQGCINWSAPAGGAKVPAGTKYPYYCYHEGGKLRRCYIGGGNQQATIAQSRVRAVEEAIAEAKSPDEIVKLIHELKRG